jgi:hypothetical protein
VGGIQVDHNDLMLRRYRIEILLVAAIVLVTAVFVRWLYIPTWADRHVSIAEERYQFEVGDPGQWFSAWSLGDGATYVLIAIDPSGEQLAAEIPEAGYRFARAGYGWAAWLLSFGQQEGVPYSLALVGALSAVGTFAVAARMRPRLGPKVWLMVLNPALFIGVAGDTSESMGILLLALALASGSWATGLLLGVTRPTFLVALWGQWRLLIPGVVTAASLGVYSLIGFGAEAMVPAGGRLSYPFYGFFEYPSIWGMMLAGVAAITVVIGFSRRDLSWVAAGAFVICFGPDVLRDPVNAWRAAGLIPVLWAFGPNFEVAGRITREGRSESAEPLNVY